MMYVVEQPVDKQLVVSEPDLLSNYLTSLTFPEFTPRINEDNILTVDVFGVFNLGELEDMLRHIAAHAVSGEMELLVYEDERPDIARMWLYTVTPGRVVAKKAHTVWETVMEEEVQR